MTDLRTVLLCPILIDILNSYVEISTCIQLTPFSIEISCLCYCFKSIFTIVKLNVIQSALDILTSYEDISTCI